MEIRQWQFTLFPVDEVLAQYSTAVESEARSSVNGIDGRREATEYSFLSPNAEQLFTCEKGEWRKLTHSSKSLTHFGLFAKTG